MKIIDNTSLLLGDDLKATVGRGALRRHGTRSGRRIGGQISVHLYAFRLVVGVKN